MLKIERIESVTGVATLRLDGRVIGPWVEELQRACEQVLRTGARLTLDLSEVWFVDRRGVRLLRILKDRDVKLVNVSGFVAELLKGEVGECTPV